MMGKIYEMKSVIGTSENDLFTLTIEGVIKGM